MAFKIFVANSCASVGSLSSIDCFSSSSPSLKTKCSSSGPYSLAPYSLRQICFSASKRAHSLSPPTLAKCAALVITRLRSCLLSLMNLNNSAAATCPSLSAISSASSNPWGPARQNAHARISTRPALAASHVAAHSYALPCTSTKCLSSSKFPSRAASKVPRRSNSDRRTGGTPTMPQRAHENDGTRRLGGRFARRARGRSRETALFSSRASSFGDIAPRVEVCGPMRAREDEPLGAESLRLQVLRVPDLAKARVTRCRRAM
mmetsp:Transcript_1412/g.4375  ORF Transcript_1412/g.4375 Transcript_1412/m.4375 type:complete len:262 (+) Transcript_1412:246-1031(+)